MLRVLPPHCGARTKMVIKFRKRHRVLRASREHMPATEDRANTALVSQQAMAGWWCGRRGTQKTKSRSGFPERALKSGSSDWTRTSDIRINSPPFYRLNYRGIVGTRRILAMPIPVVKARSHTSGLSARKSSGLLLFCRMGRFQTASKISL